MESSAPYVPLLFRRQRMEEIRFLSGLLLAFPGDALTDAMLRSASVPAIPGEEPFVGAHFRCTVPTFFGIQDPERALHVAVVDLASPPADSMFEPFAEELPEFPFAATFLEEGSTDLITMDNLMARVRKWLANELGDRMIFYSAHEEEEEGNVEAPHPTRRRSALRASGQNQADGTTSVSGRPPAAQPKAPTQKKPTVASLASKVDQIMGILPTLTAQLQSLADQHERMASAGLGASPAQAASPTTPYAQPTAGASMPVSAHLAKQAAAPATLAYVLGPRPRTRNQPEMAPTADLRTFPEDEPNTYEADPASPLIAQSAEQVSHIHSSQTGPMTELAGAAPSIGVKGSMGREKLQRELASQSGQFYLRVC